MGAVEILSSGRDDWRRFALCAGHPDRAAWFADDPEEADRAVAVCRACPVKEPCLAFALATGETLGVWGGATPRERRRLRRVAGRLTSAAG